MRVYTLLAQTPLPLHPSAQLIPFPAKKNRMRNCVCSLSTDHNVSIYSLDDMRLLYSLGMCVETGVHPLFFARQ